MLKCVCGRGHFAQLCFRISKCFSIEIECSIVTRSTIKYYLSQVVKRTAIPTKTR